MSEYIWNAIIKGVLEGVTEFLPISSTGHLILARSLFPLSGDPAHRKALEDTFDIVVQFPAILAIVVLYWSRLWASVRELPAEYPVRFWSGIFVAFVPAAALGFQYHTQIENYLEKPLPVALALIAGGAVLILIEYRRSSDTIEAAERVPLMTALSIGLFQCLALFPGVSRSGATIVGGRLSGLTRAAAAEFSFFLALPTMGGACAYKLVKSYHEINWQADGAVLLAGGVASFVSALIVVSWFIRFLQNHSLKAFGWYRIGLGALVLGLYFLPAAQKLFVSSQ